MVVDFSSEQYEIILSTIIEYHTKRLFLQSNTPTYNGQNIVRDNDDVTVITFNYRLNVFGQPSAPQLFSSTQSQNFGLLDADAAVQWVHANIEAFGGDPNRIILFGQSAGSVIIDAYTFAHPQDTIVKGEQLLSPILSASEDCLDRHH